jgi:hypothetical protein
VYFEEVIDVILDHLGLQALVAASCLSFGGTNAKPDGVHIPVYVADIIIIGSQKLISSISSRLYDRSKAAGCVPLPTFQYLGITVIQNRSKWSIAIDQVGYIDLILDSFVMANCRMCSIPLEVRHKPHAIQADEQPFDTAMYQKAVGSIVYTAIGTKPDITYAISVLGRYAAQPSTLHCEVIHHMLRYLCSPCEYILIIYNPRLQQDSNSIFSYADADLGGETDSSKSRMGIIIFGLGILMI